jgi:hypothetical protein
VGELFVEGFDVTHTKDGIQWGEIEDEVIEAIRSQLDTEALPLLDQANGYRARREAATLPAGFGAEAVQSARDALATSNTIQVLEEQLAASTEPSSVAPSTQPSIDSVLQHCEFSIHVPHRDRTWEVHLELVRESGMDWYRVVLGEGTTLEHVHIAVNLDHAFSLAFVNDNEKLLEPLLRLVAALSLAECVAREQGVRNVGAIRRTANEFLREVLSEVPIQRGRAQ